MKNKKFCHEHVFILIALITGIALVIFTPPMCTPDENVHFINSYTLSNGDVFTEVKNGEVGKYVSNNVIDFRDKYNGRFASNLNEKYSFTEMYFDSWLPIRDSGDSFLSGSVYGANPFGYTFSAFGMALGRIITQLVFSENITPYNMLLYGRIFNLIYYVGVIYFALKVTTRFKNTMLLISLMPMSIFMGASISYDAILIPTAMLLFAIYVKILDSSEEYIIGFKDIISVILCIFFMVSIKTAYIPLLLLLFTIPIYKYKNKRQFGVILGTVILVAVLAYMPNLINSYIAKDVLNTNGVYYEKQVAYLVQNFNKVPLLIINSLVMFKTYYINSFFGCLGQLDTNFPIPLIIVYYLFLLATVLFDLCTTLKTKVVNRIIGIIVVNLSVLIIFMATYIIWTARPDIVGVGASYVSGIQGRYFIPLVLFSMFPLSNDFIKQKDGIVSRISIRLVSIGYICTAYALLTIVMVVLRYW